MRHTKFHLNTDLNQKDKRPKRRNFKKKGNAEICAILGYSAAYSGTSLPTFRDNIFAHLQGPRIPKNGLSRNCRLRDIPEDPYIAAAAAAWNHEKLCCLVYRNFWTQKYIFFSIHQRVNAFSYSVYNTYFFLARMCSCSPAAIWGGGHVLVVHANI